MRAGAQSELGGLLEALRAPRRFYDVNLRRASYTPELVRESFALAHAVKINHEEAALFPDFGGAWAAAVTAGERGSEIRIGDDRARCPAYPVTVADAVGAGEGFAAAFLHALGQGWRASRPA